MELSLPGLPLLTTLDSIVLISKSTNPELASGFLGLQSSKNGCRQLLREVEGGSGTSEGYNVKVATAEGTAEWSRASEDLRVSSFVMVAVVLEHWL